MNKVVATLCLLLLLSDSISTSSLPSSWSDYYERVLAQQSNGAVCEAVAPASITCQSARHTDAGGRHSFVHVCPEFDAPTNVCYNSKLRRCCPGESTSCVSKTTLRVANQIVEVEVHTDSKGGSCIAFGDAHANTIKRCCDRTNNGLRDCTPTPNPPVCVPKRDIFFVLDATQSIGDEIFCRFGYVLQLIEDAIRPRGIEGARVATVLFENQGAGATADFLFNLDDTCSDVVSNSIPRVVYEYHQVHNQLSDGTLTYPQVDSRSTLPYSALSKVEKNIDVTRPTSVVILTDGKPQQETSTVIGRLAKKAHVIIAAGIGSKNDIDEMELRKLTNDSSNVVYESDSANVIGFAIKIVDIMKRTGALCSSEASDILTKLRERDMGASGSMEGYCRDCMWKTPDQSCIRNRFPTCGSGALTRELERELLKEEIVAEVEELMGKITYRG